MPYYRGVQVEVTSQSGAPLQEYGLQILNKRRIASVFIEAKTDFSFKICLTPSRNFQWAGDESTKDPKLDEALRPGKHEKPRPSQLVQNPPDFHLLASVFFDGRKTPERKNILYLDPKHAYYSYGGKIYFESRLVSCDDGSIKSQGWVFKDIDFETMLDRLFITGEMPVGEVSGDEEDELISAMSSATMEESEKSEPELGTIKVVLERVSIGRAYRDATFKAKHFEHDMEDQNIQTSTDCTHLIKPSKESLPYSKKEVSVIQYHRYKEGEPPWATFKFLYRGKEKLQRFPFYKTDTLAPLSRNRPKLDHHLASLTPLSISRGSPSNVVDESTDAGSTSSTTAGIFKNLATTSRNTKSTGATFASAIAPNRDRLMATDSTSESSYSVSENPDSQCLNTIKGNGFVKQSKSPMLAAPVVKPYAFDHYTSKLTSKPRSQLTGRQPVGKEGYLSRLNKNYRKASKGLDKSFLHTRQSQESDADDERDTTPTSRFSPNQASTCDLSTDSGEDSDEPECNTVKDDNGLSTGVRSISLGKRLRMDDRETSEREAPDHTKKQKIEIAIPKDSMVSSND